MTNFIHLQRGLLLTALTAAYQLTLQQSKYIGFNIPDFQNVTLISVISPVISTTLFCGEKLCNTSHAMLKEPVQVSFHHIDIAEEQGSAALCSFLEL